MARKGYLLPLLLTGPADINRALIELEQLENYLCQATVKDQAAALPKTSRLLESLAEENDADLLVAAERQQLLAFLRSVQQHAPVLHVSFAAEPSAAFTAKIVEWLRANVSKYVLVQVGLQPSIAAGCIIRSTNKVFDLSLRQQLQQHKALLRGAAGE